VEIARKPAAGTAVTSPHNAPEKALLPEKVH
jgi:hypothetical protein